ncbi:MAG TPA: hypothetical protein VER76_11600 [Pyrinomonadaceae bacterium]|nr:hypothetical protein [Pyrinomonadaceae bacterium]
MFKQHKKLVGMLLAGAVVLASLTYIFARQQGTMGKSDVPVAAWTDAEDIESRLSQKADFIPGGKSASDQLIAVAQHYRIPMGIEWVDQGRSQELDVAPPPRESNPTVRDVLQAIVLRLPGYQMTTRNGVVHITQPAFAGAAGNFLNVQIEEFQVENENLLAAKEQLRLSIDMTLHPDDYEGGYAGGYGYNPDNVFAKRNISFTGKDLTVREILDGLVKANGNALWVAQLDLDDFQTAAKPSTTKPTKNSKPEEANSKYRWDFVPLVEKPATKSETRP